MSSAQQLREDIEKLKQRLKEREQQTRSSGLITGRVLRNMSVKELRKLVKKHKIFKGITNMKKQQIIDNIISSKWFNQQPTSLSAFYKEKPKTIKIKKVKPKKTEVLQELEETPSQTEPPQAPPISAPPPPAPPIKEKKEEKEGKVEDIEKTVNPNVKNIHLKFKKGDVGKHTLDLGHTIVNIYVGSNSHPDYPIPQSLVRQALDAQNLPEKQKKTVSEFLKKEAEKAPLHNVVPQPVPILQSKKWAPVQTTKKNLPQPKGSVVKSKKVKNKQKALRKEFKKLEKSSGFNVKFKQDLENKLAIAQGLPLPYPELLEEEEEEEEEDED